MTREEQSRSIKIAECARLYKKGYSAQDIAKSMNKPVSVILHWIERDILPMLNLQKEVKEKCRKSTQRTRTRR